MPFDLFGNQDHLRASSTFLAGKCSRARDDSLAIRLSAHIPRQYRWNGDSRASNTTLDVIDMCATESQIVGRDTIETSYVHITNIGCVCVCVCDSTTSAISLSREKKNAKLWGKCSTVMGDGKAISIKHFIINMSIEMINNNYGNGTNNNNATIIKLIWITFSMLLGVAIVFGLYCIICYLYSLDIHLKFFLFLSLSLFLSLPLSLSLSRCLFISFVLVSSSVSWHQTLCSFISPLFAARIYFVDVFCFSLMPMHSQWLLSFSLSVAFHSRVSFLTFQLNS